MLKNLELYSADSFVSLIVLNGNAIIKWNDEEINIKKVIVFLFQLD